LPGDEPLIGSGASVLACYRQGQPAGRLIILKSLMSPASTVSRRVAMPVLLLGSLRRLAGWSDQPAVLSPRQILDDPVASGTSLISGDAVVLPGSRQAGSLLSEEISEASPVADGSTLGGLWKVLLVLAGAAMLVDIVLHTRGRIS